MYLIKQLHRKPLIVLGRGLLCGGLCFLLGACSTLGPTHTPKENDSLPLANTTHKESDKPIIEASYRSPTDQYKVHDLPEAKNYTVEEKHHWVDKLDNAPERIPDEPAPIVEAEPTPSPVQPEEVTKNTAPPEPQTEEIAQPVTPLASPTVTEDTEAIELPWVDDMSRASLQEAIWKQLGVMEGSNLTKRVRIGSRRVTRQHLVDTLYAFLDLLELDIPEEEFNRRLNEQFEIIIAGYPRTEHPVLFTGYYTPIIPARREKTEDFVYPLYQKPEWYPERPDLNSKRTYRLNGGYHLTQVNDRSLLTREDIDGGQALSNQQLELAWLKRRSGTLFSSYTGIGLSCISGRHPASGAIYGFQSSALPQCRQTNDRGWRH